MSRGYDLNEDEGIRSEQLYTELWVSLASLLRSYTAAHGLNGRWQAMVELGGRTITVRRGERWLKLERFEGEDAKASWLRENGAAGEFEMTAAGTLRLDGREEEMDLAAEQWARELML